MKRFLKLAGLTIPFAMVLVFASWGYVRATGQRYYMDSAVCDTFIDIKGSVAPAVSPVGQIRLYVDSTSNAIKISQNGNAFFNLTSGTTIGRNKLINGDFNIWQRGNAAQIPTGATYISDRWKCIINTQGTERFTFSQQNGSSPTGITVPFVSKIICSTSIGSIGSTTAYRFTQQIEHPVYAPCINQTNTISFWVRAHIAQTYYVLLDDGATGHGYIGSYTVNSIDTWEYKTITYIDDNSLTQTQAGDSTTAMRVSFVIDAGSSFIDNTKVGIWQTSLSTLAGTIATHLSASTSSDIWFSQVQLEIGNSATTYESLQYQQELAMCQRYCYVLTNGTNTTTNYVANGLCSATNTVFFTIHTPVNFRTLPVLTATASHWSASDSTNSATFGASLAITTNNFTTNGQNMISLTGVQNGSTWTQGRCAVVFSNTSGETLIFNADF